VLQYPCQAVSRSILGRHRAFTWGELVSDLREAAQNRLLKLAGHFAHPVRVDAVEEIGPGVYLLKVRHGSGQPDETQVTRCSAGARPR
jgi:hypothetical protein